MTDTLDTLAKRIATTRSLESIVRTMKALSGASIAQYDRAAASMSRYMRTVELGMTVALRSEEAPLDARAPNEATMAIVFGSDHGFCGSFNEAIAHAACAERALHPQLPWHWLSVGSRAAQGLEAVGETPTGRIEPPGTAERLAETSNRILLTIDDWRARHGVDRVLVFHNRRRDEAVAVHRVVLVPHDPAWLRKLQRRAWRSRSIPTFTMLQRELFAALAREHLFANVFRSGAESLASEHASRLTAMQAALRNIEEHLDAMHAEHRRKRQDAITSELLDIVGGYEILRERA